MLGRGQTQGLCQVAIAAPRNTVIAFPLCSPRLGSRYGIKQDLACRVSNHRGDDPKQHCCSCRVLGLSRILRRRPDRHTSGSRPRLQPARSPLHLPPDVMPRPGVFHCGARYVGRVDDPRFKDRRSSSIERIDRFRPGAATRARRGKRAVVPGRVCATNRTISRSGLIPCNPAVGARCAARGDLHQNRHQKDAGEAWGQARRAGLS